MAATSAEMFLLADALAPSLTAVGLTAGNVPGFEEVIPLCRSCLNSLSSAAAQTPLPGFCAAAGNGPSKTRHPGCPSRINPLRWCAPVEEVEVVERAAGKLGGGHAASPTQMVSKASRDSHALAPDSGWRPAVGDGVFQRIGRLIEQNQMFGRCRLKCRLAGPPDEERAKHDRPSPEKGRQDERTELAVALRILCVNAAGTAPVGMRVLRETGDAAAWKAALMTLGSGRRPWPRASGHRRPSQRTGRRWVGEGWCSCGYLSASEVETADDAMTRMEKNQ